MANYLSDTLIVIGFLSIGLSIWYTLKQPATKKDLTINLNKLSKRKRRDRQEEE